MQPPLALGLALREIKLRYDESSLGLVWAFLSPLLLVLIYSMFFGYFMGSRAPDDTAPPFALYLFAGYLAWDMFARAVGEGPDILRANATILTKVRVPLETVFHARVLFHLIHTLFAASVLLVATLFTGNWPGLQILGLLPLLGLLCVFTSGLAILAGVFGLFLKDFKEILGTALLAWLLATPIFYYEATLPAALAPDAWAGILYRLNPMFWFVAAARSCTISTALPSLLPFAVLTAMSALIYVASRAFLRRSRSLVLDVL